MTASRLSAVFIESLDDMIRQMPGRQVAEPWPANPAATLNPRSFYRRHAVRLHSR